MKVLCFDIGGTNIKCGVVEDAKIIERMKMPTHYEQGHEDVTDRLISTAKRFKEKYPDICGVGISCAGSINYDEGVMITPPFSIPQFGDWNFKELFYNELGLPIVADNDVNCFASCENELGMGKKYKTYLMMTVGTGIGGAIVVNNQIWRGNNYNAGEIGRMLVDGIQWEKMASMTALLKSAHLRGINVKDGAELFKLYDEGNRVAQLVVSEFYQNLGKGIANLVYIFNPEAIIIGGGISARETFGREINAYADYYLVDGFQDTLDIIPAYFKNDGGVLGAYCNFIKRYGKGNKDE